MRQQFDSRRSFRIRFAVCLGLMVVLSPLHLSAQPSPGPGAGTAAAPADTLRVIAHIATSWVEGNSVVEPLIYVDNENNFIPALAESWETHERYMDLRLRRGVSFHDGTPFNSASVLRNWERYVASAANTAPYYTIDIRKAVSSVEALDSHRVRLHFIEDAFVGQMKVYLRSFYMYSPSYFAYSGGVYPPGNQANILSAGPWGTGPYRVTEVTAGSAAYTLERNPNYWMDGYPRTSRLEIYGPAAVDTQSAYRWMQEGRADLFDAVTPSMLPALSRQPHLHRVVKHPTSHLTTLYNTRKPNSPLRDIRVRQALNFMIDRNTLSTYVSRQTARMVAFVLPLDEARNLYPYGYQPERARQLLRAAGYGPENPLELMIAYFISEERLARAIGAMIESAGVRVEYDVYQTRQDYYMRVKNYTHGPDNPIEAERWDLSVVNSGLYTNSIATHFEAFFGDGGNRWIQRDATADELFLQAMRARSIDESNDRLAELEVYLYEQHYSMPVFIWPSIFVMNERIANNSFSGSGYLLNLKEIAIDP
ncbi:MAG: ABC transporter substrate-binding protein [Spirochaetaceae bacterium]|nr:MAG: ABC transporter substrate-binding protein [Spirochaetaceae bacterium]